MHLFSGLHLTMRGLSGSLFLIVVVGGSSLVVRDLFKKTGFKLHVLRKHGG